jgi:hypothetical protein
MKAISIRTMYKANMLGTVATSPPLPAVYDETGGLGCVGWPGVLGVALGLVVAGGVVEVNGGGVVASTSLELAVFEGEEVIVTEATWVPVSVVVSTEPVAEISVLLSVQATVMVRRSVVVMVIVLGEQLATEGTEGLS